MKYLFIFAITSLFLACSSSNEMIKPVTLSNLLNLKINSTWSYEGTFLGEKIKYELKIVDVKEEVKDVKQFTYKDNKGQIYTHDKFGIRNDKFYFIKYPLEVGTSWVNKEKDEVEIATIESISEKFKFGEDELHSCIKVSYKKSIESKNVLVIRTFCTGYFLVSLETYLENTEGVAIKQSSFELKSFLY